MKLIKIKLMIRVLAVIVCLLFLQNLMACGSNCETVTRYENELEYQINGVYLSEYDKNDSDILLSESVIEDFVENRSSYILQLEPLNSYYGQQLAISATTGEGYDLRAYLTIGEKFDTLDLNESVKDSSGDYIGYVSFYLHNNPEDMEYDADPEIIVSLMSDGYHIVETIYPYTTSDDGEVEYSNTLQMEAIFENIALAGETEEQTSEYCESYFGD